MYVDHPSLYLGGRLSFIIPFAEFHIKLYIDTRIKFNTARGFSGPRYRVLDKKNNSEFYTVRNSKNEVGYLPRSRILFC